MTHPNPTDPVSALTRPDGTTEAHSTDHGRIIGLAENVMHHGATGDGSTDDSAAIQAAIDTGARAVYFPDGDYYLGDGNSITLYDGQRLVGVRLGGAIISHKNAYAFKTPLNAPCSTYISDLYFRAKAGSTSGGAIKLYGTSGSPYHSNCIIERVKAEGVTTSTDPLFYLDGIIGCVFRDMQAATCGGDGFFIDGRASGGLGFTSNANYFYNCSASVSGYGYYVTGGNGTTASIHDSIIENCYAGGIKLDNCRVVLENLWMEDNGWQNATSANANIYIAGTSGSHVLAKDVQFFYGPYNHVTAADTLTGGSYLSINSRSVDDPSNQAYYFGTGSFGEVVFMGASGGRPASELAAMGSVSPVSYVPVGGTIPIAKNFDIFLDSSRGGVLQLGEMTDPDAPASNKVRLYSKDNGAGKTQIVARFPTGAVQVIATEP